jgi:hypothetical protein
MPEFLNPKTGYTKYICHSKIFVTILPPLSKLSMLNLMSVKNVSEQAVPGFTFAPARPVALHFVATSHHISI